MYQINKRDIEVYTRRSDTDKKIKIGFTSFFIAAMAFLAVPPVIMSFGIFRLHWALIFTAVIAVSLFFTVKNVKTREGERSIELKIKDIVILSLISLVWVFFTGIGEFSWATADHVYRYAILNDLVHYKWPVIYDTSHYHSALGAAGDKAVFVYYFPFWSIPALIGKLTGLTFARILLCIQSAIGILIIIIGMFFVAGKKNYAYVVALLMFSTFDFIPFTFLDLVTEYTKGWEDWNMWLVVHSDCFQMMNVFNQCIPGWIVAVLLMQKKNTDYLGILGGLLFCYTPWAVIGMVPIVVYKFIISDEKKKIFTPGNIAVPAAILFFLAPYYTLGHMGRSGIIFDMYNSFGDYLKAFACFVVFEFGLWILVLWPRKGSVPSEKIKENKSLLIVVTIAMLLLSLYRMGGESNDLILRGSMLPMFILTLLLAEKLSVTVEMRKKKNTISLRSAGFLGMFFISALTPIMLMIASIVGTVEIYTSEGKHVNPKTEVIGSFATVGDDIFGYYGPLIPISYEYEDSFYYEVLARK